jgi:hypothetical protein
MFFLASMRKNYSFRNHFFTLISNFQVSFLFRKYNSKLTKYLHLSRLMKVN